VATLSNYRITSQKYVRIAGTASGVSQPCEQFSEMLRRWELIEDILGGTDVMRSRGERWLPRETHESMPAYCQRLQLSFLYNAVRDTIDKLTAKPFSRPVVVTPAEIDNEQIADMQDDMDGEGTNVTGFCRRLFECAAGFGLCHVLVDYTNTSDGLNLAQERESGSRPVMIAIRPQDVIGWRSERGPDGQHRLTQVRIVEESWQSSGEYGSEKIVRIRVINAPVGNAPGTWELHEQDAASGLFKKKSNGNHTFDGVPLVTIYFKRTGFMTAEPPLQDLVEMNLCHWQSSSDHRSLMRYSRFGMWKMTGMTNEELEKPVTVGPAYAFRSTVPNAEFAYVEPQGIMVKLGEEDLKRIEQRMEILGLQPLVQTTSDSTAIGKRIDESKTETMIQTWVRAIEEGMTRAYEMAAEWIGYELPDDFSIDVFNEFGISSGNASDMSVLQSIRMGGDLTRKTLLAEAQRRGILSDRVDVEKEAEAAEAEGPSLGGGGFGDPPVDPNADPEEDEDELDPNTPEDPTKKEPPIPGG